MNRRPTCCVLGTTAAALGGATQAIVKSLHEAFGVPTKEANAATCRVTRDMLSMSARPAHGRRSASAARARYPEKARRAQSSTGRWNWVTVIGPKAPIRAFAAGVIDAPVPAQPMECGAPDAACSLLGRRANAQSGTFPAARRSGISPRAHRERARADTVSCPTTSMVESMICSA